MTKRPKILIVSFYNEEAYGIRIMHSVLVNNSFNAKMLFFKLSQVGNKITDVEKNIFIDFLKNGEFDLVAFSLVSSNFVLYKSLYSDIRSGGGYKILLGGWHVTMCPEDAIQYCDFLCLGEGEEAILDVANNLFNGNTDVKNIWYNNNGNTIKNPVRRLNENIDEYPFCLFENKFSHYIEDGRLFDGDPYFLSNRYGTFVNRGCPFHCTYCSNSYMFENVYKKQWSKIRKRSAGKVIDELLSAKKSFPALKQINFYDEIFVPNTDFQNDFFPRYKKEISLPFFCMFYPGTFNEKIIERMKDAGLEGVWLGVQSGSYRVRKEVFERDYTNEDILRQVFIFKKYNISVKYDFILDNPFETKEETQETYSLMRQLPSPKKFNFFSLKYFPKTKITEMALSNGLITKNDFCSNTYIDFFQYGVSKKRESEILKAIGQNEI